MGKLGVITLLLAACLALGTGPARAGAPAAGLDLQPDRVKISAFFDGAHLRVQGRAPAGDQVGVLLASPPQEASFRVKERLWGFLWMNRETAAFHGVPTVYMFQGSQATADDFGLGLASLRAQARIKDGESDPDQLFQEFIKIKQGEGLYHLSPQGVSLGPAQEGSRAFEAAFDLPARIPQGGYQVRVFLRDPQGRVSNGPSRGLQVEEVGFPALLSSLAYNYGLLYGVLASLLALVAGLVTSLLFKGGGGAH